MFLVLVGHVLQIIQLTRASEACSSTCVIHRRRSVSNVKSLVPASVGLERVWRGRTKTHIMPHSFKLCCRSAVPESELANEDARRSSRLTKRPLDVMCFVRGYMADVELSQPPLVVLPADGRIETHRMLHSLSRPGRPQSRTPKKRVT